MDASALWKWLAWAYPVLKDPATEIEVLNVKSSILLPADTSAELERLIPHLHHIRHLHGNLRRRARIGSSFLKENRGMLTDENIDSLMKDLAHMEAIYPRLDQEYDDTRGVIESLSTRLRQLIVD